MNNNINDGDDDYDDDDDDDENLSRVTLFRDSSRVECTPNDGKF